MTVTIIIAINCFVITVNFRNRFDKALIEIFQFCRALPVGGVHKFDCISYCSKKKFYVWLT